MFAFYVKDKGCRDVYQMQDPIRANNQCQYQRLILCPWPNGTCVETQKL